MAAAPASADLASLKASCADKGTYRFCDDGVPPSGGTSPNEGAARAIAVPERYAGYVGLPAKAAPDPNSGADSHGDIALDADVTLPTTPGPHPLVVMMHTCCAGDKANFEAATPDAPGELWHYNNVWFAQRGYAVLTYTSRGFVNGHGQGSTGQTQFDSRLYEVNDLQELTCRLASDPFFAIDPRRVVVTGGSYGGGLAWMALTDPVWSCPSGVRMRLAAVAPRYGWSDLLYALAPNGTHRRDALPPADPAHASTRSPLGFARLSILSALVATGAAGQPPGMSHVTFDSGAAQGVACLLAGDPYESDPLCGDAFHALVDSYLADRSAYYQTRFFAGLRDGSVRPVPVFGAGSLTSPLFSEVEHRRMVEALRAAVPGYPVEEVYGDVGDFTQDKAKEWVAITTRLNTFVDHYARGTGPRPPFDVTADLQVCGGDSPGPSFTASSFAALAPHSLRLTATGDQVTTNAVTPNPHALDADPIGNFLANGAGCPVETSPAGPGVATYDLGPLSADTIMIGRPRLTVPHTGTGSGLQLNARLYDLAPDGTATLADRGGVIVSDPDATTTFDLNGNGWRFSAGHRLRIELTQDDQPYVRRSNQPSTLTLHGVTVDLPVR